MAPPRNRIMGRIQNDRWRRLQERVETPPSPRARIVQEPVAYGEALEMPWEVLSEDEVPEYPFPPPITAGMRLAAMEAMSQNREWRIRMSRAISMQDRENILRGFLRRQGWTALDQPAAVDPGTNVRQIEVDFENTVSVQTRSTERPTGYWKLRNGRFIAIQEMDQQHLENCIRTCERNSFNRGRRPNSSTPGVYQELIRERDRRVEQDREQHRNHQYRLQQEARQRELMRRAEVEAANPAIVTRATEEEIRQNRLEQALNRLSSTISISSGVGVAPENWGRNLRSVPPELPPEPLPVPEPLSVPDGAPKRRIKK